jgi:hypothetical protein
MRAFPNDLFVFVGALACKHHAFDDRFFILEFKIDVPVSVRPVISYDLAFYLYLAECG